MVLLLTHSDHPSVVPLVEALSGALEALAFLNADGPLPDVVQNVLCRRGLRLYSRAADEPLEAFVDELAAKEGRLDAMVVNHIGLVPGALGDITEDLFWENYRQNIELPFFATKAACRAMAKHPGGGKIIYFGSIHDQKPTGGYPLYAAAHGALQMLSREVAMQAGEQGVRTVYVELGPLADALDPLPDGPDSPFYKGYRYKIPSVTLGSYEDVAAFCAWFLSDACRYATGIEYRMDGGLVLHYVDEKANRRAHLAGEDSGCPKAPVEEG